MMGCPAHQPHVLKTRTNLQGQHLFVTARDAHAEASLAHSALFVPPVVSQILICQLGSGCKSLRSKMVRHSLSLVRRRCPPARSLRGMTLDYVCSPRPDRGRGSSVSHPTSRLRSPRRRAKGGRERLRVWSSKLRASSGIFSRFTLLVYPF